MGPKKNPNDPKWVPLGPQGDSHPKTAAIPSHDKNRLKCCLVCWRYCNEFVLNDTLKTGIHSLFAVVFDYSDRRTPLGICSTCRRGIYDFNKTGVNSKNLVLVHKTVDFIIIPAATRSEQVCTCTICKVAKAGPVMAGNFRKVSGVAKKFVQIPEVAAAAPKPTGTIPKVQAKPEPPRCPHCLGPLPHRKPCDKKFLEANMLEMAEKNPNVGERVAGRILRNKEPSPGGRVHLDTGGGRSKMKVAVDAPKGIFQKRIVSATELHTYALDLGMTITKEKKLGAIFNDLFGAMETGYKEKVREMSRLVSDVHTVFP